MYVVLFITCHIIVNSVLPSSQHPGGMMTPFFDLIGQWEGWIRFESEFESQNITCFTAPTAVSMVLCPS